MSASDENVVACLGQRAAEQPDGTAIIVPRKGGAPQTVTWRELERSVGALAAHLKETGLGPATRTLIATPPGLDLIRVVFALFWAGSAPVVVDPGMGVKRLRACVRESTPNGLVGVPLALALSRVFPKDFATVSRRVKVGRALWRSLEGGSGAEQPAAGTEPPAAASAKHPAAILYTSGSTGPPKGVLYGHEQFGAQVAFIQRHYGIEPGEVDLPLLPVFSLFDPAMGMTTVVPPVDPRKPARADPARVVEAMVEHEVTNSFGSPAIWERVGDYCLRRGITLPRVRRILMAGAPVAPRILRQFREIITHGEVHTPYGATEALPVSSINASEVLEDTAQRTESGAGTCVGRTFDGVELRIMRLHEGPVATLLGDWECPQGEIGEVIVRGAMVTRGYDGQPEASARTRIDDGAGGVWHRMGDLGYLDRGERLWFCGRVAERVPAGDMTFYTDPVEGVFNAHPDVRRCALIGLGESGPRTPALVVQPLASRFPHSTRERESFAEALRLIGRNGDQAARVRRFYFQHRLPVDVRHNIKINRLALARHYTRALR